MEGGVDFGAAVGRMIAELGERSPVYSEAARVQRAWCRCAGPEILAHTDYVFVVPDSNCGEVVIYVDSQIWATELNLQAELLRLRLNVELSHAPGGKDDAPAREGEALFDIDAAEQVKRLRFSPSKEKYTRRFAIESQDEGIEEQRRGEAVELTAEEVARLEQQVGQIEDPQLREVAFKAAKAHLELLKGEQG